METIQIYDKADPARLSPNFSVREFACRGLDCCREVLINPALVTYLQQIRDHFCQPVIINSGYRCPVHNRRIGGAIGSLHTKGMAADISVLGVTPAEVAAFAQQLGVLGIGLYETDADGYFVHLDTRTAKAFWYGQAQQPRDSFLPYSHATFTKEILSTLGVATTRQALAAAPTVSATNNHRHGVIRPLQTFLAHLGYKEVGPADGIAGAMFTQALQQYQRDHGCAPTGVAEQWGKTWHTLLQVGMGEGL